MVTDAILQGLCIMNVIKYFEYEKNMKQYAEGHFTE